MKSQSTTFATFVALSIFCFGLGIGPSTGFTIPSGIRRVDVRRQVSNVNDSPAMDTASADDEGLDDEQLLRNTSKTQLVGLCEQFRLKTKGTKEELLQRLRDFAKEQEERERQLLLDRKKRVEQGSGDEREKIEIVDSEVPDTDDDEEEVFFYYPSVEADDKKNTSQNTSPKYTAPSVITAPPPPPLDENGERVVEIYSTTDMNDLTGVAAAQPGQAAVADPMTSNIGDPINAPWETNNPQKAESTSAELNAAKEAVSDLVQSLLAMTGAPAFQQDTDDLSFLGVIRQSSSFSSPEEFVEFDPAVVPTDMLTSASKNLRTGRGRVLQEVLREFELRAIVSRFSSI